MRGLTLLTVLTLACSSGQVRRPPGMDDSGSDTAQPTVPVSHDRELRGAWVATVANINFPSTTGLSASQQQAELRSILDTLVASHLNAIFFQVRPESDALYDSDLEPWSRFLSGTQGVDPGYDPLAYLVDEAHDRGIEVHAWLNPYRAKSSSGSTAVSPHPSVTLSQYAYPYSTYVWMDPGAQAVQDHVVAVIADVVDRYDIDGVHFDDYFYPYPDGTDFPDSATYAAYQSDGGMLGLHDWRRHNVDTLVRRVSEAVATAKPHVRFGISPFGIYRPGIPPGISGLDQYDAIFSDPPEWKEQGWVDYLAPQLYWPSTQTAQAYGPLIEWWSALPVEGRYTFAGNYLSKLGSSSAWTVDEFRTQVALSRARAGQGSLGNIFFHIGPLQENQEGIRDVFRDELYPTPALTPPVFAMRGVAVGVPDVTVEDNTVTVSHSDDVFAWVVYRQQDAALIVDRIVPASTTTIDLEDGTWAISAAGRHMVESPGVTLEVGAGRSP
ncbi:MAG: family 10 glycosylhydrolase [Deltaproteobacteria bacterium]|nr:family 10 glycosylhydrolase [Deltaproteobacteria bacterium]MBW2253458.1 family 10 glycosylhydrolase [Deltaproteobacteria bacterium]